MGLHFSVSFITFPITVYRMGSDTIEYSDVLNKPELVRQNTIGDKNGDIVEQWEYKVDAVNELRAKTIVRRYVRTNVPLAKNILNPTVTDASNTEQSTITQFFPDTMKQEEYRVKLTIVR